MKEKPGPAGISDRNAADRQNKEGSDEKGRRDHYEQRSKMTASDVDPDFFLGGTIEKTSTGVEPGVHRISMPLQCSAYRSGHCRGLCKTAGIVTASHNELASIDRRSDLENSQPAGGEGADAEFLVSTWIESIRLNCLLVGLWEIDPSNILKLIEERFQFR